MTVQIVSQALRSYQALRCYQVYSLSLRLLPWRSGIPVVINYPCFLVALLYRNDFCP